MEFNYLRFYYIKILEYFRSFGFACVGHLRQIAA